jgi:hypothetical protein
MSNHESEFEKYLERRFQQAGALTPGQKLQVLESLREEAQQGRFPFGNSVASLPVENPAVQAVLRGEEVSLGKTTIKSDSGGGFAERLARLPVVARLAIVAAIPILMLLVGSLVSASGRSPEPTATATPEPSATLEPTALPQPTPEPPTPLPEPPTPLPPTPTQVFLLGGKPAQENRDPASIEIAGRLFILGKGEVKDGEWRPEGPEWLAGTEVRRVFAVPYDSLADVEIKAGDEIYVRTRGGQVLTYVVRDVVQMLANQIEIFKSLRPSIVVALPLQSGNVSGVERFVIFGEAKIEKEVIIEEAKQPATSYLVLNATNLRENPGMYGKVLFSLPAGTAVTLTTAPQVTLDGYVWLFVNTPYGYGWVAQQTLAANP